MTSKDQTQTGSAGRTAAVPPRAEWPEVGKRSEGGVVLTDVVLATFRLNARLMEAAQGMAANGGITAAWWQVLGGVLDEPRSVADAGRMMGVSRQAVQRIADLLVERGLAEYRPNPAHRRAKLLACTEAGYWAIRQISLAQGPWTTDLAKAVDLDDLRTTLSTLQTLITKLEEA
ncbi:MarR family winged helix-turn-helix transcriptional regulator [Kribbella soli]|uniref:MarR family transcriptional regulator n=1 Tax=Kribbella soli TaxID=1124743 RepID=A0A4R0HNC3_9ACTN|nr:MarR family transcriptional regulator [Kribbella soli]TCC11494.1 MarR family transcriptional regulator [Kribbella soli]